MIFSDQSLSIAPESRLCFLNHCAPNSMAPSATRLKGARTSRPHYPKLASGEAIDQTPSKPQTESADSSTNPKWTDPSSKLEDLILLKKGDRRKVICATIAKNRTAVGNDWLAKRLAMGHGSYVSTLVQRMRRDKKEQRILKKYDIL
jgi:hypothetical protein